MRRAGARATQPKKRASGVVLWQAGGLLWHTGALQLRRSVCSSAAVGAFLVAAVRHGMNGTSCAYCSIWLHRKLRPLMQQEGPPG